MDINNEILKLDWKREPYGLYEPIEYTLAAGGKRVRPQLAMIAYLTAQRRATKQSTHSPRIQTFGYGKGFAIFFYRH